MAEINYSNLDVLAEVALLYDTPNTTQNSTTDQLNSYDRYPMMHKKSRLIRELFYPEGQINYNSTNSSTQSTSPQPLDLSSSPFQSNDSPVQSTDSPQSPNLFSSSPNDGHYSTSSSPDPKFVNSSTDPQFVNSTSNFDNSSSNIVNSSSNVDNSSSNIVDQQQSTTISKKTKSSSTKKSSSKPSAKKSKFDNLENNVKLQEFVKKSIKITPKVDLNVLKDIDDVTDENLKIEVKTPKLSYTLRGMRKRKPSTKTPDHLKSEDYFKKRKLNNEAARKSRNNKNAAIRTSELKLQQLEKEREQLDFEFGSEILYIKCFQDAMIKYPKFKELVIKRIKDKQLTYFDKVLDFDLKLN